MPARRPLLAIGRYRDAKTDSILHAMIDSPCPPRDLSSPEMAWLWDLTTRLHACRSVADAEALVAQARSEVDAREHSKALLTALDETSKPVLQNLREREQLESLVVRDPLTGLFNRRHMEAELPRLVAEAIENGNSLAVAMVDLDRFHDYNEAHGHPAGDLALKAVGVLLQGYCCGDDLACRYGGEEFCLVMPGATSASARERLEALRSALAATPIHHEGRRIASVTASIGVADLTTQGAIHGASVAGLLAAADAALFAAKRAGRNAIAVAPAP